MDLVKHMAAVGSCWSPRISPDGSELAFISDLTGTPQVWTMPVEGGFPRMVTGTDDQITQVRWSTQGLA
ncbi:MAG: hypothetical protein ACFB51_22055 [Anaerolineae bacterium]